MYPYQQPLIPGDTYHLFSRAVGFEKLFLSDENYRFFLERFCKHVSPVADLFTYSLLPNHFHLLARIKPIELIIAYYEIYKEKRFDPTTDLSDFIMGRFSNWLNSYTKSFNKVHRRRGSLFMDYMKRSHALTDKDFANFLFYVHKNAIHHGYTRQMGEWKWDGYNLLLSGEPTFLLREEVMEFLGGRDGFFRFHERDVQVKPGYWEDV